MQKSILFVALALGAQAALASGFEKSIMWGGQTAGIAGVATPQISGSTSVYFNPAGLVGGAEGSNDVGLNVSPGWSTFKAPINDPNSQETSASHMAMPAGLTYSHNFGKWGFGAGYYASGGSYAAYKDQTVKSITSGFPMAGTFDVKTDLAITEFAVGGAYQVLENLKLGLAYRVVMAKASFQSVQGTANPNAYAQANLDDLKDTNYMGFKLGAQYKLSDKTDLGFMYRSETNFKAKGTQTAIVHTPTNAALQTINSDVTAGTTFPAAWTIGFKHACSEGFNAYGEYNFTEYSKVDNIALETNGTGGTPILLKMKDQHIIRIGGEWTKLALPIRAGLIWGSQVTSSDHALATGTPPGQAWVVTAGTGYSFGAFRVDGAFEYNMGKGTASSNTVHPTLANSAANEATAYSLHLGGSYTF